MTKNEIYDHLKKHNADFRQLTLDMFKTYLNNLGPELVLFGKDRIFVRLQALPLIDLKYKELVSKKNRVALMIQHSWRIKKLGKYATKLALRCRFIKNCIK